MLDDQQLLLRYAQTRSHDAFAEFVGRHVDFVYACALRRAAGDVHLADDITQEVFAAAARESAALAEHPVLAGWLYTTTRNTAARMIRTEVRRRARETQLAMIPSENAP